MIKDGHPWLVTSVPGQVEVRRSRLSGEQHSSAVPEAETVRVLSLDVSWEPPGPAFLRSCGSVC